MKISKEISIALVAIVAVVIIYFGIMFLKNVRLQSSNNLYYITMSDVNGLSPQSDVLSNGVSIGLVKSLNLDPITQLVTIAIDLKSNMELPKGTTATLSKDMLGAPKVKIMLGKRENGLLAEGDTIPGTPMSDLMSSVSSVMPTVDSLMLKLDTILTSIQVLTSDPALKNSLHNLEYLSNDLKTTTHHLNSLLGKDVPFLMKKVNTIGSNLEQTTAKLTNVDFNGVNGLLQNANATVGELQLFTNRLNNPNSSIGKFMNDPSFFNHLDTTLVTATRLLEDLQSHPKRYVHFSVFGKKDK
ncbi:MAG: MCE family protein [Bacteroidaceae bacterium]|nr:MCE family protein [Bacteroidaceae bacterium]